ncbi:hypothetical protein [Streptomyces sp. NPDC048191]|uniref:hypothetical protein n=1 Tax=Streptomyces sp. NPDC048191 TaxID=3155484 RepID=UPI0033EDB9A9
MNPEERPEPGSIRLTADNEVERFDGEDWRPYAQLPDDGHETLFRGEDESGEQDRA